MQELLSLGNLLYDYKTGDCLIEMLQTFNKNRIGINSNRALLSTIATRAWLLSRWTILFRIMTDLPCITSAGKPLLMEEKELFLLHMNTMQKKLFSLYAQFQNNAFETRVFQDEFLFYMNFIFRAIIR